MDKIYLLCCYPRKGYRNIVHAFQGLYKSPIAAMEDGKKIVLDGGEEFGVWNVYEIIEGKELDPFEYGYRLDKR